MKSLVFIFGVWILVGECQKFYFDEGVKLENTSGFWESVIDKNGNTIAKFDSEKIVGAGIYHGKHHKF